VDINILDSNSCYGGILLVLSGILYSGFFSGPNSWSIKYIGGYDGNPSIPTFTSITNAIRITSAVSGIHWLGIIYGFITTTIQSIA
jgi:hypothetical protein